MLRFALASILLFGCYDAYETGDVIAPSDGGVRTDGSVRSDAGPRPVDAGRDARMPPPPPPPICRDGTPSTYEGDRCSRQTRECVEECFAIGDEGDCVDQCIFEEPVCVECLIGVVVECAVPATMCQPQWDEFACCRDTECRGLELIDCYNGPCLEAAERMFDCFEPALDRCAEIQSLCFEP